MKIYFVIATLKLAGSESQLYRLLTQLAKNTRLDLGVIVWSHGVGHFYEKPIGELGVKIIPISEKGTYKKLKKLRRIVLSERPDIIQSYTLRLNVPIFLVTRFTRCKPVGGLRSAFWFGFANEPKIPRFLAGLLPLKKISNNVRGAEELRRLGTRFLISPKNVVVVSNKMETELTSLRSTDSLETVKTVSMSSLQKLKRIDYLIDVIEILVSRGVKIVHEHAGSGAIQDELEDLIEKKNLSDHFKLVGQVNDYNKFYENSHLMLMASLSEGSPNVLMEAACYGMPIVTTNCGDASIIVDHGKTGFVVSSKEEMAAKIEFLIRNKDLLNSMSVSARNRALEKYDVRRFPSELFNAYQNLGILTSQQIALLNHE